MPYISQSARRDFDKIMKEAKGAFSWGVTEGDLNYVLTSIVHAYISHHGVSYATLNTAIGVLECAKQELYRKIATPYEEQKIAENGDLDGIHE
jgi:broad-specificity NMP kinase